MLLSVWGSTVVLFLNIGIFYVIFATYLHFKVIRYLKFRWVFKFGISTPLPESLLLSLMLQKTEKRERERGQGTSGEDRGEKADGQGWNRKAACMGQDLEGP